MGRLSPQDREYIIFNPDNLTTKQLSEKFGVAVGTIYIYRSNGHKYKSNNKINNNKRWTKEEIEILKTYYGRKSKEVIATKLKRSVSSIEQKAHRLNIDAMEQYLDDKPNLINRTTFMELMGIKYKDYLRFKRNGLKVEKRVNRQEVLKISTILKWLKSHPDQYNATLISSILFIPEPDWLKEKRVADINKPANSTCVSNTTKELVKQMYINGMDYKEIAQRTGLTNTSIYNIVCSLDTSNVYKKWTDDEKKKLLRYKEVEKLKCSVIAKKLGRTVASVTQMYHHIKHKESRERQEDDK